MAKIIRTKEEMHKVLEWGKAFSTNHPISFFGENNVSRYEDVKKILDRVLNDTITTDELESEINEIEDEDEQFRAFEVYDWLTSDSDPPYSPEDGK